MEPEELFPICTFLETNVEMPVALKLRTVRSSPMKPKPGAETILSAYKFRHCFDDEPRSYVLSALGKTWPAAVVTPTILTLSNSVWPSTSKSAFKSIAPAKVETPATLTSVSYTHLRAHET